MLPSASTTSASQRTGYDSSVGPGWCRCGRILDYHLARLSAVPAARHRVDACVRPRLLPGSPVVIHPEVSEALEAGAPVVALESTIISHGLPRPDNLTVARQLEQVVRDGGATPATIAVVHGAVCVGLDAAQLETVANAPDVLKVGVRDIGTVVARGGNGATTVAATSHVARLAGIEIFATGGLGGVHREARDTWDESADLTTLAGIPITVVCAGIKSVLDVPATLERLETLNISLLGYRTNRFPGFYLTDSGYGLEFRVDSPAEVAAVMRARTSLASPPPSSSRTRYPRLTPWTRTSMTTCSCWHGGRRPRGRVRQGRHSVPPRLVPPADRRREPDGERGARPQQRGPRHADRGGLPAELRAHGRSTVGPAAAGVGR